MKPAARRFDRASRRLEKTLEGWNKALEGWYQALEGWTSSNEGFQRIRTSTCSSVGLGGLRLDMSKVRDCCLVFHT